MSAPDLRPHFRHLHWRPMGHSMGVDVASDFADRGAGDPVFGLYKNCGLWTREEAALLYEIASRVQGKWLDLGCHTGWTSAHIASAGNEVIAVDNMLPVESFFERFSENTKPWGVDIEPFAGTTKEYFDAADMGDRFSGVVVDADHTAPWPLYDGRMALDHLEDTGVIVFHDFIGRPVREAVEYLMGEGFKTRVYWTPHMVAACWRGDVEMPPSFHSVINTDWQRVKESMSDFAFGKCV